VSEYQLIKKDSDPYMREKETGMVYADAVQGRMSEAGVALL
jgi:hypothetical protein